MFLQAQPFVHDLQYNEICLDQLWDRYKSTEIESLKQEKRQLTKNIDELKTKLNESDNEASHLQAAPQMSVGNEVQGFTDVDDTDQIEHSAEKL
ncbi:826_t:CDS:2, partial [Dentiscutata erythropus]